MLTIEDRFRVGIGVIIQRSDGRILLGKRIEKHAPHFALPGGRMQFGETFEACAIREVKEETNLDIVDPSVIAIINNGEFYAGYHAISIIIFTSSFSGELKNCEPDKCEGWGWYEPSKLPEPLYEPCREAIACWQRGVHYLPGWEASRFKKICAPQDPSLRSG